MAHGMVASIILIILTSGEVTADFVHDKMVAWTQREFFGRHRVKILAITGDPSEWAASSTRPNIGVSRPVDATSQLVSHRISLGFNYYKQQLLFTDRGYKRIYKMKLRVPDGRVTSYNVTLQTVFSGTSSEVTGLSVDWVSGSVYWTDSLYNWITVGAANNSDIYRHIVTTGLDKPRGIALDPRNGHMYWTDEGAQPKIERASLAGTNRMILITAGLGRPRGITIDYQKERLYWADDRWDTVEWSNMDGSRRSNFKVGQATASHHLLFGIALYKDIVFVTDQLTMSLYVQNKTTGNLLRALRLGGIPYDVMMYGENRQENISSRCSALDCEHMCISEPKRGGHCLCAQNYALQEDGVSCQRSNEFRKPLYMFSLGHSLCGAHIHAPDHFSEDDVREAFHCFISNLSHVEALGFNVHANYLFYSDTEEGTLNRLRLQEGYFKEPRIMHINRGQIRGIAVDWLSSNLFWTDETRGLIMASRLDGSNPTVILTDINAPRAIAVHPSKGLMYWTSVDTVYSAHMDGSSMRVMWQNESSTPDGLVLDVSADTLYWADTGMKGIMAIELSTNVARDVIYFPQLTTAYRDVTVYQDYVAWTGGEDLLFYFSIGHSPMLSKITQHLGANVSHDIITYDEYLQPLSEGNCDDENGNCTQLCLPTPTGRTCACSMGFTLGNDGRTCISSLLMNDFLLLMDPYHKRIFQLPLGEKFSRPRGIDLLFAEDPQLIACDVDTLSVYWVDEDAEIIKAAKLNKSGDEDTFFVLPRGVGVKPGALVAAGNVGQIFYTDNTSKELYVIESAGEQARARRLVTSSTIQPTALTVSLTSRKLYWVQESEAGNSAIYAISLPIPSRLARGVMRGSLLLELTNAAVIGLAADGDMLYYWSERAIYKCDTSHPEEELVYESVEDIHKVAPDGNGLYISFKSLGSVMYYDQGIGMMSPYTESVFSFISDLKVYRSMNVESTSVVTTFSDDVTSASESIVNHRKTTPASDNNPNSLQNRENPSKPDSKNTLVYIGAGVGALILLAAILVIVILLRRRKSKKNMKEPSKTDVSLGAHDNPTYMSPDELGIQQPAAPHSFSEGDYERLPPLRDAADADPQVSEADIDSVKLEKDRMALELGVDEIAAPPPPSVSDRVKLVDEEADAGTSEVVVTVEDGGAVSFIPANSNS